MTDQTESAHGTHRPTTLQLMGSTPLRDVVRGRLTGRLDITGACARAGLPESLTRTVLNIVGKTRLWRIEKAEVGAELITHFRDGLEAGRTPEDLSRDFGDARTTARLIRRTKKQCRSILWRCWIGAWKILGLLVLVMILVYAFLFLRLHLGATVLRMNATKELNAPVLAIPVDDRAWTIYKQALRVSERVPDELVALEAQWPRVPADSPFRPDALAYLERQQPSIELIHRAASLPDLGFIVSAEIEPDLPGYDTSGNGTTWDDPAWNDNPPAISILLPYLGVLRNATTLLVFDSMVAREHNDASRVMRNLRSTISIGNHARAVPVLISDLVAIAVLSRACDEIFETLESNPSLLSDSQLAELAHLLSAFPRDGGDLVRIDAEARYFEDVLQRVYTDDGRGNGHVTASGLRFLEELTSKPPTSALERSVNPISAVLMADRASTRREHAALVASAVAAARTPLWTWTRIPGDEIDEMSGEFLWRQRYPTIFLLMPALGRSAANAHHFTQARDATLTAIALELHHRRTGSYPTTLDALVPLLLPTIPLDVFDGTPLKYTLRDGRPLLYSIGTDRKDDDGRPPDTGLFGPESQWHTRETIVAMLADPIRRRSIDGDWILYPRPVSSAPPAAVDPPQAGPRSKPVPAPSPEPTQIPVEDPVLGQSPEAQSAGS